MGVAVSSDSDHRRSYQLSKRIDQELQLEKRNNMAVLKLLLLGPAECGKSTILKQMRILHASGFSELEIVMQKSIIYNNIVSAMTKIINAMDKFHINFEELEREADVTVVLRAQKMSTNENLTMTFDLESALKKLWLDTGVQKCFQRGSEYQLIDSTKYFFDNIDRICENAYLPNEQDILRARVATTGIVEISFRVKRFVVKIFDVGGQRSERRKWIHCFDDVNAVIFIVALSEYNMVLMEDEKTNRMQESLLLFETICNSRYFVKSSMVLFMNKTDLFAEKVPVYPLTIAFPEYTGSQSYDDCLNYITTKFVHVKHDPTKQVYAHMTCATDTKCIQFVSDACFDIIFSANMSRMGLQ